jgi:hypothetical protein
MNASEQLASAHGTMRANTASSETARAASVSAAARYCGPRRLSTRSSSVVSKAKPFNASGANPTALSSVTPKSSFTAFWYCVCVRRATRVTGSTPATAGALAALPPAPELELPAAPAPPCAAVLPFPLLPAVAPVADDSVGLDTISPVHAPLPAMAPSSNAVRAARENPPRDCRERRACTVCTYRGPSEAVHSRGACGRSIGTYAEKDAAAGNLGGTKE